MRNSTAHVYRRPHPDCMRGCEYPYWHDDTHPVYCKQHVGHPIIGHTLASGEHYGGTLEFDVSVASATRWPKDAQTDVCECREAQQTRRRRHINVIQLATLLHDDTYLNVDFPSGAARSLAAILIRAADVADGLIER